MAYYKLNFELKQHHGWSIDEIENLLPYERDVYVAMIEQWLKKKQAEEDKRRGIQY